MSPFLSSNHVDLPRDGHNDQVAMGVCVCVHMCRYMYSIYVYAYMCVYIFAMHLHNTYF